MRFLCACGNEFSTQFYQFKVNNKRQCNTCGLKRTADFHRLNYNDVKKFIEFESNSGCKLLSDEYVNNSTKLHIQCKCGNIFEMAFTKFKDRINSRMCEVCRGKIAWNTDKVIAFVKENSSCELLSSEYVRHDKKLRFLCECGNEFQTTWLTFTNRNKRHCDECGMKNRISFYTIPKEVFLQELYEVHGDEYSVIGDYVNKSTKVTTRHNACGFEWEVTPQNLVGNASKKPTGCPKCNTPSKGIVRIMNYLSINNIEYQKEYWFDDCRHIYPLPFDIYLPDYNLLIEYDGEHHYMPVNYSGNINTAISQLEERKKNDEIKNQYCKNNNIPLLRIPYWEFDNIDGVLEEWLKDNIIIINKYK